MLDARKRMEQIVADLRRIDPSTLVSTTRVNDVIAVLSTALRLVDFTIDEPTVCPLINKWMAWESLSDHDRTKTWARLRLRHDWSESTSLHIRERRYLMDDKEYEALWEIEKDPNSHDPFDISVKTNDKED